MILRPHLSLQRRSLEGAPGREGAGEGTPRGGVHVGVGSSGVRASGSPSEDLGMLPLVSRKVPSPVKVEEFQFFITGHQEVKGQRDCCGIVLLSSVTLALGAPHVLRHRVAAWTREVQRGGGGVCIGQRHASVRGMDVFLFLCDL